MDRATRSLGLLAVAAMATACWRPAPAARTFEVARTSPTLGTDAEPLLLNDSITVYFSDDVQPLSVTSESVQIRDQRGQTVPGTLRVSSNWVTFHPTSPIAVDLSDGSFHPGATYRLHVAGSPRPDAVRATDGRRLAVPRVYEVRIADLHYRAPGLVGPLRPPATEVPFVLRPPVTPQALAASAPRVRLHFTNPVLPSSVDVDCFVVTFAPGSTRIRPRSARIVRSRLDALDGSTVEIDLGALLRLEDGTRNVSLQPGSVISVELAANAALTDYAGNRPLPSPVQFWNVVEGDSIALAEWPGSGDTVFLDDDPLMPGFELRNDVIRPRVRVEAGDGSLGVFRPLVDTVLRPGVPFDLGDGKKVTSRGDVFPFLAIDVQRGVKVVVDATAGPVRLLSVGGIDIAGTLEILGPAKPRVQRRVGNVAAVSELVANAPAALLAAGDVWLSGVVTAAPTAARDASPLTIAAAGRIQLGGALPCNTVLAFEEGEGRAVSGALGQAELIPAAFTPGVPDGAEFVVRGFTPWQKLPLDRDTGIVRLVGSDESMHVSWQTALAKSARPDEPETKPGSLARPQRVADRDAIAVPPGGFVRLQFEGNVATNGASASIGEVRIVDR